MSIEREIKFALDREDVEALLHDKRVRRAARGERRRSQVESTYFDTPRHALRRSGAALRVRTVDGQAEQTLKVATAGPAGLQNCREWTVPTHSREPRFDRFNDAAQAHLKYSARATFAPVFISDVERTSCELRHHRAHFEMSVDVGRLHAPAGDPSLPVCEVEFELLRGSPVALLDFLLELIEHHDLRPLRPSKAERGYALVRPSLRPRLVKAEPVMLQAAMTVGDAFARICDEALRHLHSNHDPVLRGEPGGVHQTRVAIRRIRAALRAFRDALPWAWVTAFEGEFRRCQERLAPARDWHVFRAETLPLIAARGDADARALKRLRALALHERRQALAQAQATLLGRRHTRLLLQFQRWLLELEDSGGKPLARPLAPFATQALDVTARAFLADARPLSRMSEEERHALRKAGKRARYAAEFFAALWDVPGVTPYLARMEALQDRLGDANDAVVARHLMASVAPRHLRPETLMIVQRWSRDHEQACVRMAQPVWRAMQRATPFWA